MHKYARIGAALAWLTASSVAFAADEPAPDLSSLDGVAQSEEGSDDDLFGDPDDERGAVESGEIGDTVGARDEEVILVDDEGRKKTVIKTVQRKYFMKLGRFEASPHAAFVANDPFLNRYIVGTGLAYHVTEVFAVEGTFDFAPDLGEGDWKPLTTQLVNENSVSPDISKLTMFGSLTFQYSPIYGKLAIVGRDIILFDVYGNFGMGFTRTTDDLNALQATGEQRAMATQYQTHPTTNFGGGLRIIFGESIAARVEARSMVYIETVNATTLEMKNNLILQAAASFFFPNLKN